MKTLYIECNMGAAGDMLTGALLELISEDERQRVIDKLNSLGLEGVTVTTEKSVKCGITGTHVSVKVHGEEEESHDDHEHHHHHDDHDHDHHDDHDHEHHHHDDHDHDHEHHHHHDNHEHEQHHHLHHTGMHDIESVVKGFDVSDEVKKDVLAIYQIIAEAESKAHGMEVSQIHFHEVGDKDAIADITAVCILMNMINPDKIIVSPIHVGSGHVHCAHGIMPVPAPATANILQGVPIYGGRVNGELCTPTGAAILKYYADRFDSMPVMSVNSIGYGMGKKDFEEANAVRVFLGETQDRTDEVYILSCNLDDMTGEDIGHAMDVLLEEGALDVYTEPISMKKNRPAVCLNVMCHADERDKFARLIFGSTSTIGIREAKYNRYVLDRTTKSVNIDGVDVRIKEASGYGVSKKKIEHDDLIKLYGKDYNNLDKIKHRIYEEFE